MSLVRVLEHSESDGPNLQISWMQHCKVYINNSLIVAVLPSLFSRNLCWNKSWNTLAAAYKTTMNSFAKLQLATGSSSSPVSAFCIDSFDFWMLSSWVSPYKYLIILFISNYTLALIPNWACDCESLDYCLSPFRSSSLLLASGSVFWDRTHYPTFLLAWV